MINTACKINDIYPADIVFDYNLDAEEKKVIIKHIQHTSGDKIMSNELLCACTDNCKETTSLSTEDKEIVFLNKLDGEVSKVNIYALCEGGERNLTELRDENYCKIYPGESCSIAIPDNSWSKLYWGFWWWRHIYK